MYEPLYICIGQVPDLVFVLCHLSGNYSEERLELMWTHGFDTHLRKIIVIPNASFNYLTSTKNRFPKYVAGKKSLRMALS